MYSRRLGVSALFVQVACGPLPSPVDLTASDDVGDGALTSEAATQTSAWSEDASTVPNLACDDVAEVAPSGMGINEAELCFPAPEDGRLIVQVSWPCAWDHAGATLECASEWGDDGVLWIRSTFVDGEDPDDGCEQDLVANCDVELPEAGDYCLVHGDERYPIRVGERADPWCD